MNTLKFKIWQDYYYKKFCCSFLVMIPKNNGKISTSFSDFRLIWLQFLYYYSNNTLSGYVVHSNYQLPNPFFHTFKADLTFCVLLIKKVGKSLVITHKKAYLLLWFLILPVHSGLLVYANLCYMWQAFVTIFIIIFILYFCLKNQITNRSHSHQVTSRADINGLNLVVTNNLWKLWTTYFLKENELLMIYMVV